MATVADAWRPTSELERRLQETVRTGDQEAYFRLLGESELVIPVPPGLADEVLANQAQPSWPVQDEDGRTHVLAYTSATAMRECLGPAYRHYLWLRFTDLAETWPDARWWLAVDMPAYGRGGTAPPIEARLPSWFVRQVVDGDSRPPTAGRRPRTAEEAVPAPQPVGAAGPHPRDSAAAAWSPPAGPAGRPPDLPAVPGGPDGQFPETPAPPPPRDPSPTESRGPGKHAAPSPEAGPEAGPEVRPEGGPEVAPEVAPEHTPAPEPTPPTAPDVPIGPPRDADAPAAGGDGDSHLPEKGVAAALNADPAGAPDADITRLDNPAVPAVPAVPPSVSEGADPDQAPWEELQQQHKELPPTQERPPERRPEFQPANEVERSLLRAAAGNDHDLFLQSLADAEVLLPVPEDMDYTLRPGRPGFPWQTREVDGTPVIPVFTSPERLVEAAAAAGTGTEFITLPFTVLLRYWPARGRALAVNSGSPAGGTIQAEQLPGLATWADQRAAGRMSEDFEPQNDVEQRLHDAALRRDTDTFFKVLLGAQVLVPADQETPWGISPDDPNFPWRPVEVHGTVSIQLFTSLKWMNEAIGSSRFVMPTLLDMVTAWPDTEWAMVLNPGTPIDAAMPGEQVRALSGTPSPDPAPEPAPAAAPAPAPASPQPPVPQSQPEPVPAPQPPPEPAPAPPPAPEAAQIPKTPETPPPAPLDPAPPAPTPPAPAPSPTPTEPVRAGEPAAEPPEPEFEPGNRIDQELHEAALAADSDAFLRVLLGANVLVPIPEDAPLEVTPIQREFRWEAALRGDSAVQVFTSLVRLREVLPESRFVYSGFRELIGSWPRAEWAMLLNPGSRIGASLHGDQVLALSEWAVRVGLVQSRPEVPTPPPSQQPAQAPAPVASDVAPGGTSTDLTGPPPPRDQPEPEPEPEPVRQPASVPAPQPVREPGRPEPVAPLPEPEAERVADPTIMQKVIAHHHVPWYLEQGYDRVGGFVHPTADVAELQTPIQLYEALGLLYEDAPFQPGDEGVHVIRWPAYCPGLYRVPFGGQTDEELAAWGESGWVVEHAPFLGNGFAPGSAGSIREYKVDSVRLPYGAEMYFLGLDGSEGFVAMYDPDRLAWLRPEHGTGREDDRDGQEVPR